LSSRGKTPFGSGTHRLPEWIEISGFKSLREPARVHLRPLTLLAGANSSGKSSVMQPLLMMKQTLEASYDPGPLLLNGPHVRFTRPDEFLSRGARESDFAEATEVVFGPIHGGLRRWSGDGVAMTEHASPVVRWSFRPHSRTDLNRGLGPVEMAQRVGEAWCVLSGELTPEEFAQAFSAWDPKPAALILQPGREVQIRDEAGRCSRRITAVVEHGEESVERGKYSYWAIEPADLHGKWLSCILHLPGLRGHRERKYDAARVEQRSGRIQGPGPFTAYVASMLLGWQDESDERLAFVNDSMRDLGLTWKVQAKRVSAVEVELRVGRTLRAQQGGASDLVSIADVGFGVSQVLPVVVALAAAAPGQLVYVEQPELHLHPRAQYAMGRVLAKAAQRGVCVVVETHSRMILRAVQTEVAGPEGLSPKDVGLHWFERDPAKGFATVTLAELDENGAFGDWPVDFSEVEAEVDDKWLDAAFGAAE